jgi:hypothetical protein
VGAGGEDLIYFEHFVSASGCTFWVGIPEGLSPDIDVEGIRPYLEPDPAGICHAEWTTLAELSRRFPERLVATIVSALFTTLRPSKRRQLRRLRQEKRASG